MRFWAVLMAASMLLLLAPAMPVASRAPANVVGREVATSIQRSRVVELPMLASHVALHWGGNHDALVSVAFSADGARFTPPLGVAHDEAGRQHGTETYGSV